MLPIETMSKNWRFFHTKLVLKQLPAPLPWNPYRYMSATLCVQWTEIVSRCTPMFGVGAQARHLVTLRRALVFHRPRAGIASGARHRPTRSASPRSCSPSETLPANRVAHAHESYAHGPETRCGERS